MGRLHPLLTLVKCILVPAVTTLTVTAPGRPQSPSVPPQTPPASVYDVVSIKPHQPGDRKLSFGPTKEGYAASNIMVSFLVQSAYNLAKPDQISGLPRWTADDRFDIVAKMDEQAATKFNELSPEERSRQRLLMLQAVLADRFNLKVHHETRQQPIYELVIAKGPRKIKESSPGESPNMTTASGRIVMQAMPLEAFVRNLPNSTGRAVIDETGLRGSYDFTLQWAPDGADASDPRPSLFTALEEQLGLKLVSSTAPVDILVIDHIERPSEN